MLLDRAIAGAPAAGLAERSEEVTPVPVFDVAIAGGGIVGATVACALRGSGLKVVVIEALPQATAARQAQAYAFSLLSGRIFRGLGLWETMRSRLETFTRIRLSDGDWPDVVDFEPADLGTAELGYVAEHSVLLSALQSALNDAPEITWLCPAAVTAVAYGDEWAEVAIAPKAELNGETLPQKLRAKLVVAADGGRSPLREAAGIGTRGWGYWQSCIVAAVRPERHHDQVAYERFQASGPFAILPLGDTCRIVWTAPHAEAEALAALNDDQFLAQLERRFGPQMGKLTLLGRRYTFPVRLMQSDRYCRPRLALVGEAAHNCHPVGGQGLNLGIRDAAALAETIQTAIARGEDIGSMAVLQRYDRWRRWGNLTILCFTDLLDRLFSNQIWPLMAVRRLGIFALKRIKPLKVFALKLMTGLLGRLPALAR
jgi:2-octaprenyl-6-methoxyphenol hydroxylase